MSIELKILNPLNNEKWDELVLSTQNYTFFHSSAWAKVLHDSYEYQPFYFYFIENNDLLVLVPLMEVKSIFTGLRGVSLPFSDYCSLTVHDKIEFREWFEFIVQYGKAMKWKVLEFRDGNYFSQEISPSSYFLGHVLELHNDVNKNYSNLRSHTKRNIKKAVREGVRVQFSQSLDSIKAYYHLHCMTRKKHGLPPQPFYFFKQIHHHIISESLGFVILAKYDNKNIAGAVFFHFGSKAMYKFGASDTKYQHLRANNLIMWEAIKWYAEKGYDSFCFGRTESKNTGLIQFKAGWGAKEYIIKYFNYDLKRNSFAATKQRLTGMQNKIFAKMPISLLRLSGTLLYRHIG